MDYEPRPLRGVSLRPAVPLADRAGRPAARHTGGAGAFRIGRTVSQTRRRFAERLCGHLLQWPRTSPDDALAILDCIPAPRPGTAGSEFAVRHGDRASAMSPALAALSLQTPPLCPRPMRAAPFEFYSLREVLTRMARAVLRSLALPRSAPRPSLAE